jgi:hypothetical protein
MAKYKPVKQDEKDGPLTDTEREQVRYGVSIPSIAYSAIFNGNAWSYTRPAKKFRMRDFAGYNANADFVFKWVFDEKMRTNGSSTNNYEFSCVFTWTNPATGVLGPKDLFTTAELKYYPTLVMYYATTNKWYCLSCEFSVQDLITKGWYGYGMSVLMKNTPFYSLSAGSVIQVGMFLSPQKASGSDSISGNGLSLEYESGKATKSYSLVVTKAFDDVTVTITTTHGTPTVNTSKLSISYTKIKVEITADRDCLISSIYFRLKGTIQGQNLTGVTEWLTDEYSLSKSDMTEVKENNYVTGYKWSKTFDAGWTLSTTANGQTPHGSFTVFGLFSQTTRTADQWTAGTDCYEKGQENVTF